MYLFSRCSLMKAVLIHNHILRLHENDFVSTPGMVFFLMQSPNTLWILDNCMCENFLLGGLCWTP